ncbi:pyrroline-5-carboxylate reductase [Clostridiales Family XIII bacterium PM5-7]
MLDMNTVKLGFIGYGNMAGATSRGLMLSGAIQPNQVYACAKDYEKLCKKAETEGINPCQSAKEVVDACDVIFIGVKPYMLEEVMSPLKDAVAGKVVISLVTNTWHNALEALVPKAHYLGTAPNTPVSVCEGIFVCEEDNGLTAEERVFVEELLKNLGLVLWMDEAHMGICAIVAGCAPAFVSLFMEALGDAGCKYGLTRPVAYSIIAQMLAGTGKMALQSGDHPGQMKDAVCSPSGTTIVGVSALEKNGFRFAVIDAVDQIEKKVQGKL